MPASSPEIAFRRSLRASRARRAGAARRRRRLFRGRGAAAAATAGLVVLSGGAMAHEERSRPSARTATASPIAGAQKALGIPADGIAGPQTRRAVRRFQRAQGLIVDGIVGPQTLKALGIGSGAAPAGPAPAATADAAATLARIAACESGGNATAVSSDGRYRGKYQFDRDTWRRMGGSGDPAAAPEAEQDAIAAELFEQAGTAPWPNCA
jgi:peptidoglycan hydrolase-like protein with peptidoglycan-binding domain